jgi:predicted metal-dependent peptidase
MPPGAPRRPRPRTDPATEQRLAGLRLVRRHPLFAPLAQRAAWPAGPGDGTGDDRYRCPPDGWAVVTSDGGICLHRDRRGEPEEWAWAIAHCLLHLGFGHLAVRHHKDWTAAAGLPPRARWPRTAAADGFDPAWNLAACVTVNRFLAHLKIGRPPAGLGEEAGPQQLAGPGHSASTGPSASPGHSVSTGHSASPAGQEERLASRLREFTGPLNLSAAGTGGPGGDLRWAGAAGGRAGRAQVDWPDLLAAGLADAVGAAVDVAGGAAASLTGEGGRRARTPWRQALGWFVSSYPLLGGVAAAFKLVEDAEVCRLHGIAVAAISPSAAELYVNPLTGGDEGERRFVIAHELLHAALRHDTRGGGRDPWLWNVACDYVINGWLTEMSVGDLPAAVLYDPALKGKSAEEVYDQIAAGRRRARKLATLRGYGAPDILPGRLGGADPAGGVDLDEFYRRCLADGLAYHRGQGRGLLPGGLIEEIRALTEPPVPWDVELARWFDAHFAPLERRRSYARASRRQAATPDIPRPGWYRPEELSDSRTFGVVLDTSGSMDRRLLGKALGAIAAYAVSRDVAAVRVVFCDARAHDSGWMHPFDIAGRVRVRGRGGTVLQPGVDLLLAAADFPKDGPVLVITDGWIDRVRISREHAFLIPAGATLPFPPRGPVFRFS